MTDQANPALLPNGLMDLLPPYAEKEADVIGLFMGVFASFGYRRVKPPLVEFEESLLGEGPGKSLARNTFRLMDPVSRHMMGVRADVTAQIARISGSRLAGEPRPLRLSYAGDVLRVNGTQLRPERQFCQAGCELIGRDTVFADVELALVALKALSAAEIPNLSIDLTVPALVERLYEEAKVSVEDRAALDDLIEKRDRTGLEARGSAVSQILATLMNGEKPNGRRINLPGAAGQDMDRLQDVAAGLRNALDIYGLQNVRITLDPLERRGFEYQTGVSFTLFALGVRGELGRGGRYNIQSGAKAETASGFTLYMDTILRAAPMEETAPSETVPDGTDWERIRILQEQGKRIRIA